MLVKWDLRSQPNASNPWRYQLLLKADREDVIRLIRAFSNLCGRPVATQTDDGFNWTIDMRSLIPSSKSALTTFLGMMTTPVAVPASTAQIEPPPQILEPQSPAAAPSIEPALEPQADASPETQDSESSAAPEPAPAAAPAEPSLPEMPALVESAQAPIQEPAPEAESLLATPATPVASIEPLTPTVRHRVAEEKLEEAIDFDRDFESLMVGPHNRFAHAAATSVVDSPASLYNPLFLFGPPGVGKTHLLHAIAAALSQTLGPEGIILTSGFRLSYLLDPMRGGSQLYPIEALENRMRALIIDDFHLTQVTDSNKPELARLFAACIKKKCQIVAGSLYPPRALPVLEQALGISFGKGWAVDLKVPGEAARPDIFKFFCRRQGLAFGEREIEAAVTASQSDYAEGFRLLARLDAFKKMRQNLGATTIPDILPVLLDPNKPALPDRTLLESAKRFKPPTPGPGAEAMVVFSQQGHDAEGAWALARFYQAAGHYGFAANYRQLLGRSYDDSQGTPFRMGRACRHADAKVALIVGPAEDFPLFSRAAEFRHVVMHVLASAGVRAAWIAHDEIAKSAPFLTAHLDLSAGITHY